MTAQRIHSTLEVTGRTGRVWLVRLFCVLWVAVMCGGKVDAQEVEEMSREDGWERFVEEMSELSAMSDEEGEWDEQMMEDMYELYCNPLNLNDLDAEDLKRIPGIRKVQVVDVMDYVDRHKPVLSVGELMAVNTLDYRTRRLLQLFCTAGEMPKKESSVWERLKRAKQDLVVRTDIPFYTKSGFADYSEEVLMQSPNKVYQGTRLYHSLRWQMQVERHVEAGVQMEKDVGEKGVDYMAGYAVLKDLGRLHTLAIGDYRVSWGQGLVVNTSMAMGKLMMLSRVGRLDQGIRRHSSMTESGFMRGVAAAVDVGSDWRLSAFASHRNADGTLRDEGRGVSTLKLDGLHRTASERARHGNLEKSDAGVNVGWSRGDFRASASAVWTHLSLPLAPVFNTPSSRYRKYNAQGQDFGAYGLAYQWNGGILRFTGESALSSSGGYATINTLQTELWNTEFTLMQRYYSARYVAVNGKAFGENRLTQNEGGIYLGMRRNLSRRLSVDAYIDGMYFPWMKYQVSNTSKALDCMVQMQWEPSNRQSLSLRLRAKGKEHDWQNGLETRWTNNARLVHQWAVSDSWSLKTTAVANFAGLQGAWQTGFALSETAKWRHETDNGTRKKKKLTVSLTTTYFNTDGYYSRIFLYEPSLLYSFGMTQHMYHGLRTALLCSVPVGHNLSLIGKLGSTRYFNRSTIGTGLDLIQQNHREDLQLQLRWKK